MHVKRHVVPINLVREDPLIKSRLLYLNGRKPHPSEIALTQPLTEVSVPVVHAAHRDTTGTPPCVRRERAKSRPGASKHLSRPAPMIGLDFVPERSIRIAHCPALIGAAPEPR